MMPNKQFIVIAFGCTLVADPCHGQAAPQPLPSYSITLTDATVNAIFTALSEAKLKDGIGAFLELRQQIDAAKQHATAEQMQARVRAAKERMPQQQPNKEPGQ